MTEPAQQPPPTPASWRQRWHEIIFEADTPAGRLFDVLLLAAILASVLAVMLESVEDIRLEYGRWLLAAEIFFTAIFTVEYVARIMVSERPMRYVFSFYGLVDVLSILPGYVMLILPGAQRLTVIRSLRLLRAFRIFKLGHMLSEGQALQAAVYASRAKLAVFLAVVVVAIVIVGAAMHLIEGTHNSGFSSIPKSMYWAVVTMTTVGYGDIAPQSVVGQSLAAAMMILGYSMIVIPTGIVSAELAHHNPHRLTTTQVCSQCLREGHDTDAAFCKFCGAKL